MADTGDSSFLLSVYDLFAKFSEFHVVQCVHGMEDCLLVTHRQLYDYPPLGMMSRCRVTVKNYEYIVQVVTREVKRGSINSENAYSVVTTLCHKYSPFSQEYKFCPGLLPTVYDEYKKVIRYDLKSVRRIQEPFDRVASVNCLLWFKLGKRASKERRDASEVECSKCVCLRCDLEHQKRRTENENPAKKLKRQEASSRAPLTYMSPASQSKRVQNQRIERGKDRRKIRQFENVDVPLDCEQDTELKDVVTFIDRNFGNELEKLYEEADKYDVAEELREVWMTDVQREKAIFNRDQSQNSKRLHYQMHY